MIFHIFLACVLTAAGGYLLGSILFGVLISKVMYNDVYDFPGTASSTQPI